MARIAPGWHAENIKAEIRKKYGTLSAFAAEIGVAQQSLSGAINSPIKSARIELMIAEGLGVAAHELWPERWTSAGQKIDRAAMRRTLMDGRAAA